MTEVLDRKAAFAALPPVWPDDPLPRIAAGAARHGRLVVLDDDPTGTQTVHEVAVLTAWEVETLRKEFTTETPGFYVLTNSRSLDAEAAGELNRKLAANLTAAAAGAPFTVVSRSDSTLRGHFPAETDALAQMLGPFDATFLFPYFEAGGRYTLDDVHYVAEGDQLLPAAATPFARDAAFGYRSSNLREWVEEKTGGKVPAAAVHSISLEDLRQGGPAVVAARLEALPAGATCVVNAAAPRDAEVFAAATLRAEHSGKRYVYRTAAEFVRARLGQTPRPLLTRADFELPDGAGLFVVGSHVPKTTSQLQRLLRQPGLCRLELSVPEVLASPDPGCLVPRLVEQVNAALTAGTDTVVYTSREVVKAPSETDSLRLGARVSEALVRLVQGLAVRPRYLVAKGGITSSDLATRGLCVRRGWVRGQVLPGVPVWELGEETRFPGMPYVVFPGNVGDASALSQVREALG